jgi:hypothetical protein
MALAALTRASVRASEDASCDGREIAGGPGVI